MLLVFIIGSLALIHNQNGVVEHKHKHVIKISLSLLAHASLPFKYWDMAFLLQSWSLILFLCLFLIMTILIMFFMENNLIVVYSKFLVVVVILCFDRVININLISNFISLILRLSFQS